MTDSYSVIAELEKTLVEKPDNINARIELATHYMVKGDYYTAAAELQRVVRAVPPNETYKEAYYQLGMVLRTLGNFGEALNCMKKVIEIDGKDANALYYAGILQSELGNYQEAAQLLRRSVELLPQQSYLYYALGNAELHIGNMDEAITQFKQGLSIDGKDTQLRNSLVLACLLKGAYKEAAKEIQQIFSINPKDPMATFYYAWTGIKEEKEVEALEKIEKLIHRDPHNTYGFFALSALHYMIGEYSLGKEAYLKGLKLLKGIKDPMIQSILQILTSSLVEMAEDKEIYEEEEIETKKDLEKAFLEIMEQKDPLLREKSKAVGKLAYDMAKADGDFDDDEIDEIRRAGTLCNLGMAMLPDSLVNKEEKLNDEEKKLLSHHPLLSVKVLENVELYTEICDFIRHHHERYNGTGYPDHLKADDIPLGAEIVGVADFFVELTKGSKRQKPASQDEVVKTIQTLSRQGSFSKRVVELLVKAVTPA